MIAEPDLRAAFQEHKNAVYGFAWRMSNSATLAEDITQEVFLSLLHRPFQADRSNDQLRSFLLGIARNLALKHWRQDKRWKPLDDNQLVATPPDIERLDLVDAVASAVAVLPPLQREVLILNVYQGLSLQEIAGITGAEIGAIKARLHRARENLRRILAPLKNTRSSEEYGTAK